MRSACGVRGEQIVQFLLCRRQVYTQHGIAFSDALFQSLFELTFCQPLDLLGCEVEGAFGLDIITHEFLLK